MSVRREEIFLPSKIPRALRTWTITQSSWVEQTAIILHFSLKRHKYGAQSRYSRHSTSPSCRPLAAPPITDSLAPDCRICPLNRARSIRQHTHSCLPCFLMRFCLPQRRDSHTSSRATIRFLRIKGCSCNTVDPTNIDRPSPTRRSTQTTAASSHHAIHSTLHTITPRSMLRSPLSYPPHAHHHQNRRSLAVPSQTLLPAKATQTTGPPQRPSSCPR